MDDGERRALPAVTFRSARMRPSQIRGENAITLAARTVVLVNQQGENGMS